MADARLQLCRVAAFLVACCLGMWPTGFSHPSKEKDLVRKACLKRGLRPDSILAKIDADVLAARKSNKAKGLRGTVRCGCVWRGQRKDEIPYRKDSLSLFVSKGKGGLGNALSPFNVRTPQEMTKSWATEDGTFGGKLLPLDQPLELVWQAAKVGEAEQWPAYFARRAQIYRKGKPQRRYLDRSTAIAGSCFGVSQELVPYVPARSFYCNAYEKALSKIQEFKFLEDLVAEGFNLMLLGPDGHPVSEEDGAVSNAYKDGKKQFGHERVLVAMLRQQFPWQKEPCCWLE